jgi:hypothetical protein
MMHLTRRIIQRGFRLYDGLYRQIFRLEAVGPLLYLGRARYRGPARVLADHTPLHPGEPVGTLHFNNARIASLYQLYGAGRRMIFHYTRLLLASLQALAAKAQVAPELRDVMVYQGISWLRPHGERFGFQVEALPDGSRAFLLRCHFRLLLYASAPEDKFRNIGPIRPHVFWLTRQQLIKHFFQENSGDDASETLHKSRPGVPGTE